MIVKDILKNSGDYLSEFTLAIENKFHIRDTLKKIQDSLFNPVADPDKKNLHNIDIVSCQDCWKS